MLALNSQTYPIPPTKLQPPTNRIPQYSQQSELKEKTQFFKVEIRNSQVRDLKHRCRQKLLRTNQIQQFLSEMPLNSSQSMDWCLQFINIYKEAESHCLSADQIISIFWLAEKHINRFTLELLELVVIRAPSHSLDLLFQYDVMKLLHTAIVSSDLTEVTLNRSCFSQQSQAIIKEVVLPTNTSRINLPNDHDNRQRDLLEIVRTSISIIGWLCMKSAHIRNFAVINHKTYTYCLKAYKKYNSQVEKEFFRFLEAATHIDFKRNEEQFNRISAKILNTVFSSNWKLQYSEHQSFDDTLSCIGSLISAAKNLVSMKETWTLHKIELTENKYKRSLFEIGARVITEVSWIMQQGKEVAGRLHGALEAAIGLCMHYYDYLELISKLNSDPSLGRCRKEQMSALYPQLLIILSQLRNNPLFDQSRRMIYFMLNNQLVDEDLCQSYRHSVLELNYKGFQLSLIDMLADSLPLQTVPLCLYELAYLLHSIFLTIPLELLSPLIFHNHLIQSIGGRIVESLAFEDHEELGKTLLIKGIIILLERMKREANSLAIGVREILLHQFGNQLKGMLEQTKCKGMLYDEINRLLMSLEEEEWIQG